MVVVGRGRAIIGTPSSESTDTRTPFHHYVRGRAQCARRGCSKHTCGAPGAASAAADTRSTPASRSTRAQAQPRACRNSGKSWAPSPSDLNSRHPLSASDLNESTGIDAAPHEPHPLIRERANPRAAPRAAAPRASASRTSRPASSGGNTIPNTCPPGLHPWRCAEATASIMVSPETTHTPRKAPSSVPSSATKLSHHHITAPPWPSCRVRSKSP